MRIDLRLLRFTNTSRIYLGATIALGFLAGLCTILQARTISHIIAQVFLNDKTLSGVSNYLGMLFLLLLIRAGLVCMSEITAKKSSIRIKSDLREQFLKHVQTLGPIYIGNERSGELTNLATEGIETLDAYFSQYIPQLVLAVLVPLTFLLFVFPLDALTGLVMLLTAPLIPFFMVLIGNMGRNLTKRQWQALSHISAHLTDIFQGLTTLKIFCRSREQDQIIAQTSERYRKTTLEVLRITFLSALVLELVSTLSTAIVAVEIGLRLLYGQLEFEQAFFVLLIAPEFYLPLRMLGMRFHAAISGTEVAKRLFSFFQTIPPNALDLPTSNPIRTSPQSSTDLLPTQRKESPPRIVFKEVGFTYPDGREVLQGISFEIGSGQRVALVGPSGAGKSTLAYLLLGFIQPTHGQIFVNDQPLDQIPTEEWRRQIAWLPQNPYLFNDSVLANIRLANPEASLEEVILAAQISGAHEFIESLPQGYQTKIGERGARLSAGEAQRIALSRAFLSKAHLIIFDEPTSNLDPETEESITQAQTRLFHGRTSLVIAHRLNTVRNADFIIVLAEGRVVQMGTHSSLSQQSGLYQRLIRHYSEQMNILPSRSPKRADRSLDASDQIAIPSTTIEDTHRPSSGLGNTAVLIRLLSLLKPFMREMILSVSLGFATIACSIGLMSTSAYIISFAALKPSIAALQVAITGVRVFGIGRGIFRYLERLVSHDVTFRLLTRLRTTFYQAIEPLAPARLLYTPVGDLLSRAIADIASLENFYVRAIAPPFVALLTGLFTWLFLAGFHPSFAFTMLIFYLLASIGIPLAIHLLSHHPNQQLVYARSKLYSAIMDSILGISDLQVFRAQHQFLQGVKLIQGKFNRTQEALSLMGGLQSAFLFLATHLCVWAVLWLMIPLTTSGILNGIYLAVIVIAVLTSFEAILPLPQAAHSLGESLQAARRLFELILSPPEVKDPVQPLTLSCETKMHPVNLTIRNLCFFYPSLYPDTSFALEGITFTLSHGKHIAIVGPSGAGKTTLINLLLRFWEFKEGEILLNGEDIRRYRQEDVRRLMAVVSQNTYLFNASVRENLLIARPEASQAEIERAAQVAQIHSFIQSLPNGYETKIGERGLFLSAGERQRLGIARAVLKDSPLLILDEPTANLDSLTERQVLQAIFALMANRSTLLITHRLVMMDLMDEIIVLCKGHIVERGTHAELLASGGYYRRLFDLQSQVLIMDDLDSRSMNE